MQKVLNYIRNVCSGTFVPGIYASPKAVSLILISRKKEILEMLNTSGKHEVKTKWKCFVCTLRQTGENYLLLYELPSDIVKLWRILFFLSCRLGVTFSRQKLSDSVCLLEATSGSGAN